MVSANRCSIILVTVLLVARAWQPLWVPSPGETTGAVSVSTPPGRMQSNASVALERYAPANSQAFASTPIPTIRTWLDLFNKYRCMHGVQPLKWSDRLAKVAEWRAKNCGVCQHCLCQGVSCNPDNAAQWSETATCQPDTPATAVSGWYSEVANYSYSSPAWAKNTGHFILVVAKTASEVGCYCSSKHCYCDYDTTFKTSPPTAAELSQVVLKATRTEAACQPDGVVYSPTQNKWQSSTPKCWQIDGHPLYGQDAGRNCTVYWTLGASAPPVIAYGEKNPQWPAGVAWGYSQGGGVWQGGGAPDWSWQNCWRLQGFQSWQSVLWCSTTAMPTMRGIRVAQQSGCWEQVNANESGTGLVYCEY